MLDGPLYQPCACVHPCTCARVCVCSYTLLGVPYVLLMYAVNLVCGIPRDHHNVSCAFVWLSVILHPLLPLWDGCNGPVLQRGGVRVDRTAVCWHVWRLWLLSVEHTLPTSGATVEEAAAPLWIASSYSFVSTIVPASLPLF